MAFPHLFEPITIGPLTVPNRLVMAPMERNYGNPDGTPSERTIAHYRLRAAGGVGWVDVESTFVDPVGRGRTHQLGLDTDRAIDAFLPLVDAIHAGGAVAGIELHHAGRNTCRAVSGYQPVAPSPVPCPEAGGEVPHELTIGEIDEIVARYVGAARRAAEAGFDAVELHSAHGYLPLAFLSPLTNHRSDEYGGSFENRCRFGVRVVSEIRAALPDDVIIGCRFSVDEGLPGGLELADGIAYAQALEQAGVRYLSVSSGVYASFERIIPTMDVAAGWLLPAAAAVRAAVSIPVIGGSRITEPADAERAVSAGQVDLVALGRALLTDPELPRKARAGRLDDAVYCIGCNQGCEARVARQRDVTCLVNPAVGRELTLGSPVPAELPRVVAVVGGGPAGLEVSRICAERGHHVTLFEREKRLGGEIAHAAEIPGRGGWRTFVEQAERRVRASGADIRLGCDVDPSLLRSFGADVIVLATGARFLSIRNVQEDGSVSWLTPGELFGSHLPPGRVVVDGGGPIGLGAAAWLAARSVQVSVVAPEPELVDPEGQGGLVARLLGTGHISLALDREIVSVAGTTVKLVRSGAIGDLFPEPITDVVAVIMTRDRQARDELGVLCGKSWPGTQIFSIGDCRFPRTALEAVYEAADLGRKI